MGHYIDVWKKIFYMVKTVEFTQPLTYGILSDPNNEFVKTLIYIYSMESFIFSEMNIASREKLKKKI